jgi:hypothetical protein
MTGLFIRELIVRGDLRRCLIVAPGSLVEQWQAELSEKFHLDFTLLTRDRIDGSASGNPFADADLQIAAGKLSPRRPHCCSTTPLIGISSSSTGHGSAQLFSGESRRRSDVSWRNGSGPYPALPAPHRRRTTARRRTSCFMSLLDPTARAQRKASDAAPPVSGPVTPAS